MSNYQELLDAMDRGCVVEVNGRTYKKGQKGDKLPKGTEDAPTEGIVLYGPDGTLSYEGMRARILAGESVMYKGEIISSLNDLPHPVDVARDDLGDLRRYEEQLIARKKLLAEDEERWREQVDNASARVRQAQQDSPKAKTPGGARKTTPKGTPEAAAGAFDRAGLIDRLAKANPDVTTDEFEAMTDDDLREMDSAGSAVLP